MNNPFEIIEPTCISFSGGRTSAYMLYRILEAHQMSLPKEAIVCFANTGKEDEATLRFVDRCSKEWGVDIHWVEYRDADPAFERVTFETASRNGEPFEAIIRKRRYLPNPVTRFCTAELKVRTINKYLKSLGWTDHNENMDWVGMRADEQRRAAKIADKSRIPLVTAGVTKETVGEFWKLQSFDLELPNINGVTYHGNCDLCFLKGGSQVLSLIAEKPERAIWWAKMEKEVQDLHQDYNSRGAVFRFDRANYAQMSKFANEQTDMFDKNEESIACFCGD
jgi:3'-phosphoadenosine 5'-phosphosulfate sulfotransferase (PAPS reductase)/FAD synthetase